MVNIINTALAALSPVGYLLNKGIPQYIGFINLITLLTLWLLINILVINKCTAGLQAFLHVVLTCVLCLAFKSKSLLVFYISFEFSVLPITLIIFLFGYQPEKLYASLALVLYTILGGLPLLLYLLYRDFVISSFLYGSLLSIPITLAFLIKTPMYLLHIWLPKAHVEAPVGGSMVLAGVILKLGSYGLLLFMPLIAFNRLLGFYLSITLVGMVVRALICLRQGDLKLLIAYSSIVHMGVVTLGFIRGSEMGYNCAFMMVVAHGWCSPLLFAFSFWFYSASHSRLLINNTCSWPAVIGCFFCLIALNLGVPPSLGLWSEVLLTIRVLSVLRSGFVPLLAVFFLGATYNLYLYIRCAHAKPTALNNFIPDSAYLQVLQVVFFSFFSSLCLDLVSV